MNNDNRLTPMVIRQALLQIAQNLGREPYSPIVVREVINSFSTKTHHHLKDLVVSEANFILEYNVKKIKPVDIRLEKLRIFCANNSKMMNYLSVCSGIEEQKIQDILNETATLNDACWRLLFCAFDRAETMALRESKMMKVHVGNDVNKKITSLRDLVGKYVGSHA